MACLVMESFVNVGGDVSAVLHEVCKCELTFGTDH